MTESKSSMSPLYNQLDLSCSNCGIPVVLRSQARYLAVHDPDTGDLICKQCRLEKWDSEATSDYDDDYDEDVYENDDDGEEDDNDGIFIDGDIIYYPHIDKTSSRSHINSGDQKGLTTITLGPLWSQQMFVKTCLRALRQVEAPCTPRRANFNTAHSAAPLFARREVRLASARHLDVKAPSSSSALPACDLCLESLSILNMALEHAHHSTVYCDNCRQCLCFHHLLSHNRTLGDLGHKVVPVQSRNQVDRKEEDELVSIDVCKNDLPSWQTEDCLSVACGPCNMPIYWRGNPNPRREKILGLLTLPFPIDPARAESIDIAEGEGRSNVLLSASHSLTIVHDRLTSFVHRLTDISSFAVRQIRALSSNNSCTIASIQWGKLSDDVERILKSLCGSYNKGLQSLKRTLHYIEGTLLEAIAMLGLEGVTDREEMQEILLLGKWPLANELLLMETLGCLRDTLEYGDVGGLSRLNVTSLDECLANIDVLTCIMTTMQTDCVALEAIGEIGHTTEEKLFGHIISLFQGVIALDSVYFDMFTSPLPRESLRSLLEWKIELGCQLHPEGLLEEIIKALVYDNMMPTGKRDQHTLNLIERFYTIDSPDIHLAKALLKYSGLVGSNYLLFSQAQEKGCNHPLLFYYLGDCYVAGIDIDKDLEKAAMCYQKAIEGMFSALTTFYPVILPSIYSIIYFPLSLILVLPFAYSLPHRRI